VGAADSIGVAWRVWAVSKERRQAAQKLKAVSHENSGALRLLHPLGFHFDPANQKHIEPLVSGLCARVTFLRGLLVRTGDERSRQSRLLRLAAAGGVLPTLTGEQLCDLYALLAVAIRDSASTNENVYPPIWYL
jgi:hypothetical protein